MTVLDGSDVIGPGDEPEPMALVDIDDVGALQVLRRGVAESPELREGFWGTVIRSLGVAGSKLLVPVTIQLIIDRGLSGDEVDLSKVVSFASLAALLLIASIFLERATYFRLGCMAENVLKGLRVRVFAHLHKLSLAEHTASKKGVLTARVTSDVETLTRFAQWGAIAWVVDTFQIIAVLTLMTYYSWELTLVTLAVHIPLIPTLRIMQYRQLRAYDKLRTRVSETLGSISETVMGMQTIRSYGQRKAARERIDTAIDAQYKQQMRAARYFSFIIPMTDIFGVVAIASVVGAGVWWGNSWDLTSGELIAFIFLVNLLLSPITQLGEVLDQTQTALAGWWKILKVLDTPIEIPDKNTGPEIQTGPLSVKAEGVEFAYREGDRVLHGINVDLPAGSSVAIVGETGSGKTTFAKLIARLADPTAGNLFIGGVNLKEMASQDRRSVIRMVPQDGFLFDTTVAENIRYGRPDATDDEIAEAINSLDLRPWIESLPDGENTLVGERGESLSVGERQLVALVRAQLADPGLLVLDEATSSVDPETETVLEHALERLAEGRTTISVAHRLSTAERSDLVLVFDHGNLVEQGPHEVLKDQGGVYNKLYDSWLGNTREGSNGSY
ncbi:MAG: multidrug ABC transporter ATP-binding protein [Acidimicrobiaceae bacterium]|jgi:ATP-binding cassette subfamily B protein|nr:multidrug ABC transporter ATP-binding protein [Acidimicrobiaceae bacterium]MEC9035113.1 ABC transporter ATP-binding protein [Actinomycetota bacterium]|tara:strand:- start:505 stop:2346 length:1842 start_codon:yes stop_codon:yes gene_type:complete